MPHNEYVRHVVVSAVCANRDCPNKDNEIGGGTYSLIRFTHPDTPITGQVRWAATANPPKDVEVWLCTDCAATVMAASSPGKDYAKVIREVLALIQPAIQGKSVLDLSKLIMIEMALADAVGTTEVR